MLWRDALAGCSDGALHERAWRGQLCLAGCSGGCSGKVLCFIKEAYARAWNKRPARGQQEASKKPARGQQEASKRPARCQQGPVRGQQEASKRPARGEQEARKRPARGQEEAPNTGDPTKHRNHRKTSIFIEFTGFANRLKNRFSREILVGKLEASKRPARGRQEASKRPARSQQEVS